MIGLTGLINNNNTCYMNSILQLISICNTLCEVITEDNNINNNTVKHFKKFIIDKWINKVKISNPIGVQFSLDKFKNNLQHDAHEFLIYFLNEVEKYNESLVKEIFDGEILSTVQCEKCNNQSQTKQDFRILSLDLQYSLEYAIKTFLNNEQLDEFNMCYCENCKTKQTCIKKTYIDTYPKYLFINLKRFNWEKKGIKNNGYITYPSYLQLKNDLYSLKGIINHFGNFNGGHYTAACYVNDIWLYYNDTNVREITEEKALHYNESCYLFLYEKQMKIDSL